MKWWMRERDQLIEQTLAFVEGVKAAKPVRAEPARPVERPVVAPPKPREPDFMLDERTAIQKRVANFKAQQQKFQREREAHFDAVFAKARPAPGNSSRA